jgi:HPt (histidine-containing phosphotransfer) domain-containing protein
LKPWDHIRALNGVGGDVQFLNELAGIFCAAYPTLLKSLEESIAAKDLSGVADTAHLLAGAAHNLSACGTAGTALAIETMARRNEFEGIESAYRVLRREVERLVDALKKFRTGQHLSKKHSRDK